MHIIFKTKKLYVLVILLAVLLQATPTYIPYKWSGESVSRNFCNIRYAHCTEPFRLDSVAVKFTCRKHMEG